MSSINLVIYLLTSWLMVKNGSFP